MRANDKIALHNVKANIEHARRTSDKLIGFGPFGIGLDGILTWVPVVGQVYTLGAAAYLLTQGVKARAPGIVLWQMSALFVTDLAIGAIPVVGAIPDMLFCGHLWAGWLLKRAIERTAYIERAGDKGMPPPSEIADAMAAGHRIVILNHA